ncbi:amidohydrolase [Parasphingorhabdus sp. DH2-15]|uniref:amidohydrolase n=1 Tax=Parasphingorhabdus sp. DH2-15 TaxID=3444112 RepID=UPI003F687919
MMTPLGKTIARMMLALWLALMGSGASANEPLAKNQSYPDITIYEAQSIITMEPALPEAKFVAVADGIILSVAQDLESLKPWTDGRKVTINRDYADKVLMPGFIEPHIHPMQAILMLPLPFIAPEEWELPGRTYPAASNAEDYERLLRRELAKSDAPLFLSWGHHALFHGELTRAELDRIAPDRPVVIWQRSFHEIIANSAALNLLGIGTSDAFAKTLFKPGIDPSHASFEKGTIGETALFGGIDLLRPYLFSPANISNGLSQLRQMLLENGVTTAADMAFGGFGGVQTEAPLFKSLFDRADTPTRIVVVPVSTVIDKEPNLWLKETQAAYASEKMLFTDRVKLFADGAFFAQYMQLNAPGYSDGHEGRWLTEPEMLAALTQKFWNAGWSIHTHVNGDKGLDVVLGISEQLRPSNSQNLVMEHLGFSTEAQNRRLADLDIWVSAQPNYIRILGDVYARSGLGPDRAAQMNRLGSLERKNVPIGLHSDFNMAPIDPLYLAWVASNRVTLEGNVKSPSEALSLDKAMRAITIEAAQIIGMDDVVGSIASGKKADFVVLGSNPYEQGADKLRDIAVEAVIFEGQVFTP